MSAKIISFSDVAKKGLSIATGWDAGKKAFYASRRLLVNEQAVEGAKEIKSLWTRLLTNKDPVRTETFAEACSRLHLTEQNILERRNGLMFEANIFRVFTLASLASAIVGSAIETDLLMAVVVAIGGISATLMFGALAFSRAFRVWQIDRRELAGPGAFFQDSGLLRIVWG